MSKYRSLVYGAPVPQDWFDALQEFLSTQVSPNFTLTLANPTTVQVVAGADNDQVSVALNGKWRYISATTNLAHPGGGAGAYDVWVVASANSFAAGGPSGEVDNTDYTFGLRIVASGGAAPTGTFNGHAIAHTRKVGSLTWSGSAITDIRQDIGLPLHAASHAPAGADALPWTTIHGQGTFAGRPAAATTNAGYMYFATDTAIVYRSNGSTWDAQSPSSSSIAQAILLSGTLGTRPAAAAGNSGFYYFATDTSVLYQSDGAAWNVRVQPNMQGTLAARPAAAAANRGVMYYATDQDSTSISNGSAWTRYGVQAGDIIFTRETTTRTGCVICTGQAWPATTGIWADLFAKWGGAFPTNLPDDQGRFLVGKGTHTDIDAVTKNDGYAVGLRRPSHKHNATTNVTSNATSNASSSAVSNAVSNATSNATTDAAFYSGGPPSVQTGTPNVGLDPGASVSVSTNVSTTVDTNVSTNVSTTVSSNATTTVGPQTGNEPTNTVPFGVVVYQVHL